MGKIVFVLTCCALFAGCSVKPLTPSAGHLHDLVHTNGTIPAPVRQSAPVPAPKPGQKVDTYSVTVFKVPVQELLFALARDAKLNVDIHPDIEGTVTLNALDQSLPQLLSRIAKQVDMRYELDGPNLIVLPDLPFLRNYKVDYVNIARSTTSNVNIATQIATTGGAGSSGNNNSTTLVSNTSNNYFWKSLELNIKELLRDGVTVGPNNAAAEPTSKTDSAPAAAPNATATTQKATSVIVNAEAGVIAVRATSRQHEKIQEFLDLLLASAKRQVLIEATIIEIKLSDQYQQGINWSVLRSNPATGLGLTQGQNGSGTLPSGVAPGSVPGMFTLAYANPTSIIGNLSATIQLLESFGQVKVLSSPKISVINNQTALLKVVDNSVYFTITATPATRDAQGTITSPAIYTSQLNTVPVGFVMSVTPQISDADEITLNVRPTITRIVGYVPDPNPALASSNVVSKVPIIQAREMESILKVANGQIAVMGGLMQDSVDMVKDAVPGLSRLPVVGDAFSYRNETSTKTELVIFIRPVVIKNASLDGEYRDYRDFLPKHSAPAPELAQPPASDAPVPHSGAHPL